jgi:hypothetical protein
MAQLGQNKAISTLPGVMGATWLAGLPGAATGSN